MDSHHAFQSCVDRVIVGIQDDTNLLGEPARNHHTNLAIIFAAFVTRLHHNDNVFGVHCVLLSGAMGLPTMEPRPLLTESQPGQVNIRISVAQTKLHENLFLFVPLAVRVDQDLRLLKGLRRWFFLSGGGVLPSSIDLAAREEFCKRKTPEAD